MKKLEEEERKPRSGSLFRPREKRGSISEKDYEDSHGLSTIKNFMRKNYWTLRQRNREIIDSTDDERVLQELSCGTALSQQDLETWKQIVIAKLNSKKCNEFLKCRDKAGQGILHVAIQNCPDLVPMLLKKGADINEKNVRGESPLTIAAICANETIFSQLLSKGAIPDSKTLQNFCSHLCSHNYKQSLETMFQLNKQLSINGDPGKENSPLHCAISNSRVIFSHEPKQCSELLVKVLLSMKADVNVKNHRGDTPLHWCILTDNVNCARLLLKHHATIDVTGSSNLTPLELAENEQKFKCARLLLMVAGLRKALSFQECSEKTRDDIIRKFVKYKADETGLDKIDKKSLERMGFTDSDIIETILSSTKSISSLVHSSQVLTNSSYRLVGQCLKTEIVLSGSNFIGRDNFVGVAERVLQKELEFFITNEGAVNVKLGEKSKNKENIRIERMETGDKVSMECENYYLLKPGDKIHLFDKYNIILVQEMERPKSGKVEHWLNSIPRSCKNPQPPIPSEAEIKQLELVLLSHKLKRKTDLYSIGYAYNSLFYSISYQLYQSTSEAKTIRTKAVEWLLQNKEFKLPNGDTLGSFITNQSWEDYCKGLEEGNWGDGLTLVAISEIYGVYITVFTSNSGSLLSNVLIPRSHQSREYPHILLSLLYPLFFDALIQDVAESTIWMTQTYNDSETYTIDPNEVVLRDVLGRGADSEVYFAFWNGYAVCAKKITHTSLQVQKQREVFKLEVALLMKLRHPHIILFMGTMELKGELYIVTEFMERGSLQGLLKARNQSFEWTQILRMAMDIAQGMNYLHTYKPQIIHRDLKTGNILVDQDFKLKIADFGYAKLLRKKINVNRNLYTTLAWTAPEVFKAKGYNHKIDIYSFGIVLWSLLTGKEPWEAIPAFSIIPLVLHEEKRPLLPENPPVPKEFIALIEKSWDQNPEVRPEFGNILVELKEMQNHLGHDYVPTPFPSLKFANPSEDEHEIEFWKQKLEEEKQFRKTLSQNSGQEENKVLEQILTELSEIKDLQQKGNEPQTEDAIQDTFALLLQKQRVLEDALEKTNKGAVFFSLVALETALEKIKAWKAIVWSRSKELTWMIKYDDLKFDKTKPIGSGNSAKVFKGTYRKNEVAIKVLNSAPDLEEFKKELDVLYSVRNPHFVFFYGACVTPSYCIITEIMHMGSLKDVMCDPKYKINWKKVFRFCDQMTRGLQCLHNWEPPVYHRDIKSANMLVSNYDVVKICDLGLARFVGKNSNTLFQAKGSLAYMAPEVWNSQGFTAKSDIYSLSIVFWELLYRCYFGTWSVPYPNIHIFAAIAMISEGMRPKIFIGMPPKFVELIKSMWAAKSEERLSCDQVLEKLNEIQKDYSEHKEEWNKFIANIEDAIPEKQPGFYEEEEEEENYSENY